MPTTYYAHSGASDDCRDWQPLAEHLRNVAEKARLRAVAARTAAFGLSEAALVAGLLHDLGKYRVEFQEYLHDCRDKGNPLTFHKQAGAAKALFHFNHAPIALAVMGHHGGIPDWTTLKADLKQLAGEPTAQIVWPYAIDDCPELAALAPGVPTLRGIHADLFTRVLFSCLVDADWTDTGEHDRKCKGLAVEPDPPALDPSARLAKVLSYIESRARQCPEQHIKNIRAQILDACLNRADDVPGVFSLTVPTGGGKTLAGLAFALKHAAKRDLRRIIYVAPYMSILEQNISVFREALGIGPDAADLFEHYSLAELPGDADGNETNREASVRRAENWDAPVIVTTNVQFFESLFSNKPGRCRKLHNIARSVVILDECQSLPPGLVAPTCCMLQQLVTDLGCSIVLCTATQPAFNHASLKTVERLDAREIIPGELDLFKDLKRVTLMWPQAGDMPLTWSNVAEQMQQEPSALCVVNTKKAARAIFDELKNRSTPGLYHLSTAMCPAHRREKLAAIRRLLAIGSPCFVVSTQLIEAGVDVDFPFLMRELAPLESIIQAAGRCNREGRIVEGGRVVVFRSAEGKIPPDHWYKAGRDTLSTHFLARGYVPQIDDPAIIREYYGRLYFSGDLDGEGIQAMRQKFQFKQVAEAYRLIDNAGQPVVISKWTPFQNEIEELLVEIQRRPAKALFRRLARFQVNLFPHQILRASHLIHEDPSGVVVWDGDYDDDTGIVEEIADSFIV